MGVLSQPLFGIITTSSSPHPPFPSTRFAKLFYEFLSRYNEWQTVKLQKQLLKTMIFFLGIVSLATLLLASYDGAIISICLIVPLFLTAQKYIEVNERVSHLYVNVQILHHHLIGKLEVGFCDHVEICHCAENFCKYVAKNYGIILNQGLFIK